MNASVLVFDLITFELVAETRNSSNIRFDFLIYM